jgi:hypothetical protein
MLAHDLTVVRLDHACASPAHKLVVRALVGSHDLTEDQSRLILARVRRNTGTIRHWLTHRHYPSGIEDDLLSLVPDSERAYFSARSPHQFDQERLAQVVTLLPAGPGVARAALALMANPNAGDDVQETALTSVVSNSHFGGADSCLAIREHAGHLPALTRPWGQADTADELDLLQSLCGTEQVPRVAAARMSVRAAERLRARQAGGLGHIGEDFTQHALAGGTPDLSLPVTQVTYQPAASLAAHALETRLDALGPAAWETAAVLLAGEYTGGAEQLVATCDRLSRTAAPVRLSVRSARVPGGAAREQ